MDVVGPVCWPGNRGLVTGPGREPATLVLGVAGTLIASRHPGNPIGWLFCGLALWGAVAELGEAYGVAAWVVVVLLFPDGRLPGRR